MTSTKRYMRNFKRIIQAVILSCISGAGLAQQVPMYSQYIMNGFLVNPSFAGRDGYTTVNLTVREQWVGMADAPSTYAASFQTRLMKNSYISKTTKVKKKIVKPTRGGKVGLGGYVFNDQNGIMRRTGAQGTYAYHIPMGSTEGLPNNLSFGLALTAYNYSIDTEGQIYDPDDPFINSYDNSVYIADFNFGTSYSTSKFYVGFAMTNLLRGAWVMGDTSGVKRNELGHYFLTGGYRFELSSEWTLEPSAFIKSSDLFFNTVQADITARFYYKNDYWAGLSYRTSDAIIFLMGIKYDKFYFAYAYDYALTDIRSQTLGTHELTLAVKFGDSARRYRWLSGY